MLRLGLINAFPLAQTDLAMYLLCMARELQAKYILKHHFLMIYLSGQGLLKLSEVV